MLRVLVTRFVIGMQGLLYLCVPLTCCSVGIVQTILTGHSISSPLHHGTLEARLRVTALFAWATYCCLNSIVTVTSSTLSHGPPCTCTTLQPSAFHLDGHTFIGTVRLKICEHCRDNPPSTPLLAGCTPGSLALLCSNRAHARNCAFFHLLQISTLPRCGLSLLSCPSSRVLCAALTLQSPIIPTRDNGFESGSQNLQILLQKSLERTLPVPMETTSSAQYILLLFMQHYLLSLYLNSLLKILKPFELS